MYPVSIRATKFQSASGVQKPSAAARSESTLLCSGVSQSTRRSPRDPNINST